MVQMAAPYGSMVAPLTLQQMCEQFATGMAAVTTGDAGEGVDARPAGNQGLMAGPSGQVEQRARGGSEDLADRYAWAIHACD